MTEQTAAAETFEWTMQDRLRKAREIAEIDQIALAEDMGVSRQTVSNYERGLVKPRRIVLKAWALRTGAPMEWLQTGRWPVAPQPPSSGHQPAG